MKPLLIALAVTGSLSACVVTSPNAVAWQDTQRMSTVLDATVLSVRNVYVEAPQTGAGAFAGSVAGGVAGSSIGGYREGLVAGVLGAVAGAVIGDAVERGIAREDAVELIVQLRNGERRAIVQAKGGESLQVGDPVLLVTTGGRVRVSRAPAPGAAPSTTKAPPPAAPAVSPGAPPMPIYTPR